VPAGELDARLRILADKAYIGFILWHVVHFRECNWHVLSDVVPITMAFFGFFLENIFEHANTQINPQKPA